MGLESVMMLHSLSSAYLNLNWKNLMSYWKKLTVDFMFFLYKIEYLDDSIVKLDFYIFYLEIQNKLKSYFSRINLDVIKSIWFI
ncbi:unnamed protein product [Blepharisma stoltei]|uniref:Uncharacterized protein n=1 Tax=Blepharisma stoltei TaxID=1481888 RepID=A0AAU9JD29_9CILI|nr:unnamed protein product [Blepharisma stoltei]